MQSTHSKQLCLPDLGRVADVDSGVFRPIHYIGSKLRVLSSIRDVIGSVAPGAGPVCDLFAGSGIVSMSLAMVRPVVSVDIQEYSRVICSALLNRPKIDPAASEQFLELARSHATRVRSAIAPLIDYEEQCLRASSTGSLENLCVLIESGSILANRFGGETTPSRHLSRAIESAHSGLCGLGIDKSPETMLTRYFGGVYFSYGQAADLDGVLSATAAQKDELRDFYLAVALSTASSVVNTVGKHFAQPIRPRDSQGQPKKHLVSKVLEDRSYDVLETYAAWLESYLRYRAEASRNVVIRGDFSDVLDLYDGSLDVIYADPPYTRDHYSRFYHVLETMCRRDNPPVSTIRVGGEDQISRGLYRTDRHQSPFCIRSQAPGAFRRLMVSARRHSAPLVISYSPDTDYEGARPRVMTIDAIRQLALECYRSVDVAEVTSISHSKLNHASRILGRAANAERLIICQI